MLIFFFLIILNISLWIINLDLKRFKNVNRMMAYYISFVKFTFIY